MTSGPGRERPEPLCVPPRRWPTPPAPRARPSLWADPPATQLRHPTARADTRCGRSAQHAAHALALARAQHARQPGQPPGDLLPWLGLTVPALPTRRRWPPPTRTTLCRAPSGCGAPTRRAIARPVMIMPWIRAVRATVDTPQGPMAVWRIAPRFASTQCPAAVRHGATTRRGSWRTRCGPSRCPRVMGVGDFNGSTDDRALAGVIDGMLSAPAEADAGSDSVGRHRSGWPGSTRSASVAPLSISAWTLPHTGRDHLPVAASVGAAVSVGCWPGRVWLARLLRAHRAERLPSVSGGTPTCSAAAPYGTTFRCR